MDSDHILAFVLAGGEGERLRPLTSEEAKPAVPFVGGYRLIDFVLSNLVNSGVSAIYVLAQYKPQSLIDHLAAAWGPRHQGAPAARATDRVTRAPRVRYSRTWRWWRASGRNWWRCFAADHVYRMDLRQMAAFHRTRAAQVSVAAVAVPIESAPSFGVIAAKGDGSVREFQEKPLRPRPLPGDASHAYASMGNYLFEPGVLAQVLDETVRRGGTDFGRHVLPHLPGRCVRLRL